MHGITVRSSYILISMDRLLERVKVVWERFPWTMIVALIGGAGIMYLAITAYYLYVVPFQNVGSEFETKPEEIVVPKSSGTIDLTSGFDGGDSRIDR